MWWILAIGFGIAIALIVGKCISFGTNNMNDDYMIGDEDPDEGDRS